VNEREIFHLIWVSLENEKRMRMVNIFLILRVLWQLTTLKGFNEEFIFFFTNIMKNLSKACKTRQNPRPVHFSSYSLLERFCIIKKNKLLHSSWKLCFFPFPFLHFFFSKLSPPKLPQRPLHYVWMCEEL
jgi:hypothetical protein